MGYSSFPMNGGDGAFSYSKNSQFQKEASDLARPMIEEAVIHKLDAEAISSTVAIADLGCSVGPNTFFTVQNLIEAVQSKWKKHHLEFQVLFNDHSANDFNTLLASLPPPPDRPYHAAAVPGSFHGRLFPCNSITLAHSSFALHWLSRVPQGITVSNKARIFYARETRDEVLRAYQEQFERDMGDFVSARAQEIVKGGLMFLIIPGVADGVAHAFATAFHLFHATLTDLAAQGVIGEAEMEGFNLPIYYPSAAEVREVVEENGCFSIERVEFINPSFKISARAIIHLLRAVMEGIFTQHFGESVMEKMFHNTLAKAQEASHLLEADLYHSLHLFYVLKRK